MNRKYLDNQKNAKTLVVVLSLLALIAAAVAVFATTKMSTTFNVLLVASMLCLVLLSCFLMHYVRHNGNDASLGFGTAMHGYNIHGLLICFALFAGVWSLFSGRLFHSLLDGALASALMLMIGFFLKKDGFGKKPLLAVLVGVILAILTYMNVGFVNIIFIGLAVILAICAFSGNKRSLVLCAVALALAVGVPMALSFTKDAELMHMIMHVLSMLTLVLGGLGAIALCPGVLALDKEKESSGASSDAIAKEKKDSSKEDGSMASMEKKDLVIKEYWPKSYKEIMKAPVYAIRGVSEGDAKLLKSAFGIDTVEEFANNRFFEWACEITAEANKEK